MGTPEMSQQDFEHQTRDLTPAEADRRARELVAEAHTSGQWTALPERLRVLRQVAGASAPGPTGERGSSWAARTLGGLD